MFFNIGGPEILVIAMVALIAVGPDQLPGVLRKIGRYAAQARSMTAGIRDEFMSGLDEVKDMADPDQWLGSGTDDDPVVPRGHATQSSTDDVQTVTEPANGDGEPPDGAGTAGDGTNGDVTDGDDS